MPAHKVNPKQMYKLRWFASIRNTKYQKPIKPYCTFPDAIGAFNVHKLFSIELQNHTHRIFDLIVNVQLDVDCGVTKKTSAHNISQ